MDDESLPAADFDLILDDRTEISSAPPECDWVEPSEPVPALAPVPAPALAPVPAPTRVPVPVTGIRHLDRLAPAPTTEEVHAEAGHDRRSTDAADSTERAAVGGRVTLTEAMPGARGRQSPAVGVADPARLLEIWPEPPRKRQLPKRLRIVLAGLGVFLVVVIAFGGPGTKLQTQAPAPLADDLMVSADELKNRREVRADDFRPHGPGAARTQPTMTVPPSASAETQAESLAERRVRRAKDPEDVLTLRARRESTTPSAAEVPFFEGPVYVTAVGVAHDRETMNPTADATKANAVATAGTSIPAVLTSPLEFAGGSATVVARVERASGALRGGRFVGTASAGAGRVTLRFHSVLLADGRKARVDAEAQDEDGSFGLRVEGAPQAAENDTDSVLGDVAAETATDLVSDAIGAGVAGRAVDRALTGSRSRRSGRPSGRVSLAAGTKLQIFLHEPLEVGP